MNRSLIVALLVAVVGMTSIPAGVCAERPALPTITEKQKVRLSAGKLVLSTEDGEDAGKKLVVGLIEIAAPPERIWPVLLGNEHILASSSSVKEVTTYHDQTSADGIRDLRLAFTLKVGWTEIRYHSARNYDAASNHLSWSLDLERPNDIKWTEGSYSTWPAASPGKTLFLYKAFIQTGKRIPRWLEEELTESSLKKYLLYVKKIAERTNG